MQASCRRLKPHYLNLTFQVLDAIGDVVALIKCFLNVSLVDYCELEKDNTILRR